jgi:hypothetical protein
MLSDVGTKANPYHNCNDVYASWDWISLDTCGPYPYEELETYPYDDMYSTASSYVTDYYWGSGVVFYWIGRVTPAGSPAYYSAGYQVF